MNFTLRITDKIAKSSFPTRNRNNVKVKMLIDYKMMSNLFK